MAVSDKLYGSREYYRMGMGSIRYIVWEYGYDCMGVWIRYMGVSDTSCGSIGYVIWEYQIRYMGVLDTSYGSMYVLGSTRYIIQKY